MDSEARHIFELLSHVRAVTVHFDEIDDLMRRRDPGVPSLAFLDLVVPAMLNRLQDLREACPRQEICFLLTTNYIEKIEPALMRKGRIDRPVAVVYPDADSRESILWHAAQGKENILKSAEFNIANLLSKGNVAEYLKKTCYWPWGTINAALEEFFQYVNKTVGNFFEKEMQQTLFLKAVEKHDSVHNLQEFRDLDHLFKRTHGHGVSHAATLPERSERQPMGTGNGSFCGGRNRPTS